MSDDKVSQKGEEERKASKLIVEAMRLNKIHPMDCVGGMLLLIVSTCKAFQVPNEEFSKLMDLIKKGYAEAHLPGNIEKKISEFWSKQ